MKSKAEYLYQIAQNIIKISKHFHKEKRDIIYEIEENDHYVTSIIRQETERIRMKEKGKVQ